MSSRFLTASFACLLAASSLKAGVINLVVLAPEDLVFQQTAASPCVIGGSNCINGAFPYTLAGSGGAGTLFDETSPLYGLDQITGVTGSNSFIVALDYNDTAAPQRLDLFQAVYYSDVAGTTVLGTDTYTGPTSLKTNNNGVGYSDFILEGFAIPNGTQSVRFSAVWFNNDGPDRYFLIGANEPPGPNPVPEPSTSILLGAGLAAALVLKRRARKA